MPINEYSPQNPYAQQEYYSQVPPRGYGYAGFGAGGNGKSRPWRRFDDQPKSVALEEFRSGRSNRPWTLKVSMDLCAVQRADGCESQH